MEKEPLAECKIFAYWVSFSRISEIRMNQSGIVFASLLLFSTLCLAQPHPDLGAAAADSGETKGSTLLQWEVEESQIQAQLARFSRDYSFPNPQSDPYDTLLLTSRRFRPDEVPTYSPREISQRMYDLPMVIQMDYNHEVQRYIELYTLRRREQVSRMLGLSRVYFPIFEEELDRKGLPLELKYLSVVESALNPHAVSRVGATGLWQFMLGTAKMYGLQVDSYVDERRDPYKSTEAAMRYLEQSYREFGDWLLAIASYNCGPGNVRKAIRRAGGEKDFWKIMEYLPRETRGYVPAFLAVSYVFNYASEHNIFPVYPDFSLQTDTVHLTRMDLTLAELADALQVEVDVLRNLNPELKLDQIPYSSQPYVLRMTPLAADRYAIKERELRAKYGQRRDQLPPEIAARYAAEQRANPSAPTVTAARTASAPAGKTLVYYTVRNGDVVGSIADKYGVSPSQIASWNGLRKYRIRVGQKLKIYTTKDRAEQAGARLAPERLPVASTTAAPTPAIIGQAVYHKVQSGDTLWGIANQYPGASVDQIRSLNQGLSASNLRIGQTIRVK